MHFLKEIYLKKNAPLLISRKSLPTSPQSNREWVTQTIDSLTGFRFWKNPMINESSEFWECGFGNPRQFPSKTGVWFQSHYHSFALISKLYMSPDFLTLSDFLVNQDFITLRSIFELTLLVFADLECIAELFLVLPRANR